MKKFKRVLCTAVAAVVLTSTFAVSAGAAAASKTAAVTTQAVSKTDDISKIIQGKWYFQRGGKEYYIEFGAKNTFTLFYYDSPDGGNKGTFTTAKSPNGADYIISCKSGELESNVYYVPSTGELTLGGVDTSETSGVWLAPLSKSHVNKIPAVKTSTASSTRIGVSWSKVDGAEKYAVYMKSSVNSGYKLLDTVSGLNYTATKLQPASKYSFRVTPLDKYGKTVAGGSQSNAVPGVTGGYYKKSYTTQEKIGGVTVSEKTAYSYDMGGNLTDYAYYENDKMKFKTAYTYDGGGNLLTETKYNSQGTAVGDKVSYAYAEGGYLTLKTRTSGVTAYEDRYTYDGSGNMLTAASFTNGVQDYFTEIHTYDDKGNELTLSFGANNPPAYIYTYDSKGNRATATYNGGVVPSKTVYTYDGKGNMLTSVNTDANGSEKHTFVYDSDGNLLSETIKDGFKYVYTYDGKGNKLSQTDYNSVGKAINKYTYTYDSVGNLLKVTGKNDFDKNYTY